MCQHSHPDAAAMKAVDAQAEVVRHEVAKMNRMYEEIRNPQPTRQVTAMITPQEDDNLEKIARHTGKDKADVIRGLISGLLCTCAFCHDERVNIN